MGCSLSCFPRESRVRALRSHFAAVVSVIGGQMACTASFGSNGLRLWPATLSAVGQKYGGHTPLLSLWELISFQNLLEKCLMGWGVEENLSQRNASLPAGFMYVRVLDSWPWTFAFAVTWSWIDDGRWLSAQKQNHRGFPSNGVPSSKSFILFESLYSVRWKQWYHLTSVGQLVVRKICTGKRMKFNTVKLVMWG